MGKSTILLLAAVIASNAHAQTAMFSSIAPQPNDQTPPPTAVAVYPSTFNHLGMRGNPASITIAIPRAGGTTTVVAQRRAFRGSEGFAADGSPLPSASAPSFRHEWTGAGGGHDVRVSYRYGAVAGVIDGPSGRYVIRTRLVEELNRAAYPTDDSAANDAAEPAAAALRSSLEPTAVRKETNAAGPRDFDLLVLYTDEARRGACVAAVGDGDPTSCQECGNAADIRVIIDRAVADTRIAYADSQVTTSIGSVTVKPLAGFPETTTATQARREVLLSEVVARERDAASADVVSVFTAPGQVMGACGVAFVQRPGCTYPTATEGCGMGADFENFALNIVSHACAIATDAFVHELTHNHGGEHEPGNGVPPIAAALPYHFGHVVPGLFETVMSVGRPPNTPQVLLLSNPNVLWGGEPTGIHDERDNARGVNALYEPFRSFRDGPLFADAFEGEDSCRAVQF